MVSICGPRSRKNQRQIPGHRLCGRHRLFVIPHNVPLTGGVPIVMPEPVASFQEMGDKYNDGRQSVFRHGGTLPEITLIFIAPVGYGVGYCNIYQIKKDLEFLLSPCYYFGSGDRI